MLDLSVPEQDRYWQAYIQDGFKKGAGRAFDDTKKPALATDPQQLQYYKGTKDEFLRSAFAQPETIGKLKLLVSRVYSELEGVSQAMANKMQRLLADGLVRGDGADAISRRLRDDLKMTAKRAETVARTEIVRAHAEGQLAAMQSLGVKEIGVMVEWSTAGDGRVCPACTSLSGVVLKIEEAQGLIPRHPNCRCAFIPANVGEMTKDQIRKREDIEAAIKKSVKKSNPTKPEDTPWQGADTKISKPRPRPKVKPMKGGKSYQPPKPVQTPPQPPVPPPAKPPEPKTPVVSPPPAPAAQTKVPSVPEPKWLTEQGTQFPMPSQLTKIEDLPGSTAPKLVIDSRNKKWVMKEKGTPGHLESEVLADKFYDKSSTGGPLSALVKEGDRVVKVSEYIEGAQPLGKWMKTASVKEQEYVIGLLQEDFVLDAWAGNWDVIGLSLDNVLMKDGFPIRIDNGGAFFYRAQGALKKDFATTVTELKSMRSLQNPSTHRIFGSLSDDEVKKQLKQLNPSRVNQLLYGMPKDLQKAMRSRLKIMKQQVKEWDVAKKAADQAEKATAAKQALADKAAQAQAAKTAELQAKLAAQQAATAEKAAKFQAMKDEFDATEQALANAILEQKELAATTAAVQETKTVAAIGDEFKGVPADFSSKARRKKGPQPLANPRELKKAALTPAEQKAIERFSGSYSSGINFEARKISKAEKLKQKYVPSGYDKTTAGYVKSIDSALDKLPGFEGILMRGVNTVKNYEQYKTGAWAQYELDAFSSTSAKIKGAFDKNYIVVIKSKGYQGSHIRHLSLHSGEDEVLMKRKSVFRVVGTHEGKAPLFNGKPLYSGDKKMLIVEETDDLIPLYQAKPAPLKPEDITNLLEGPEAVNNRIYSKSLNQWNSSDVPKTYDEQVKWANETVVAKPKPDISSFIEPEALDIDEIPVKPVTQAELNKYYKKMGYSKDTAKALTKTEVNKIKSIIQSEKKVAAKAKAAKEAAKKLPTAKSEKVLPDLEVQKEFLTELGYKKHIEGMSAKEITELAKKKSLEYDMPIASLSKPKPATVTKTKTKPMSQITDADVFAYVKKMGYSDTYVSGMTKKQIAFTKKLMKDLAELEAM